MSGLHNLTPPAWVVPVEVPVEIAPGTDVMVKPCNIGQITRMIATAAPAVGLLMALPEDLLDRLAEPQALTRDDMADLFDVLNKHPEQLTELVAIASRLSADQVRALLPDRFAFLFAVVVALNADFFSRAIPVFDAAGRVLQQIKPQPAVAPAPPGIAPSAA